MRFCLHGGYLPAQLETLLNREMTYSQQTLANSEQSSRFPIAQKLSVSDYVFRLSLWLEFSFPNYIFQILFSVLCL